LNITIISDIKSDIADLKSSLIKTIKKIKLKYLGFIKKFIRKSGVFH